MTKIVKSISLDESTIAIANSKKNFSGWVREQLLMDIQYTIPCYFFTVYHTDRKGKKLFEKITAPDGSVSKRPLVTEEVCNGQKKPHCAKCYPSGPPTREDWLLYTQRRIDLDELQNRAKATWKWKTDQIEAKNRQISEALSKNQENDPQMGGKSVKRAYVRRLLTWIWSFIW
jgi:hypothetical protein